MTRKERQDVRNTAGNWGYKASSYDGTVQINGNGDKIKHIDNNRTLIGGTLYYGSSAAKKAITGKK